MVLHTVTLLDKLLRPAQSRRPTCGIRAHHGLVSRSVLALVSTFILYFDGTGFRWWGQVERGLGAVVEIRRKGYSLDSVAVESFRDCLGIC